MTRGFTNNPLFQGKGLQALQGLSAANVFATLIPRDTNFLEMELNAGLGGGPLAPITFGALSFAYIFSRQPGDLNSDGSVDAADAELMVTNWGSDGQGDLNDDGIVDNADAGLMFENWTGDGSNAHAVPEPTGGRIVALGALLLVQRHQRLEHVFSLSDVDGPTSKSSSKKTSAFAALQRMVGRRSVDSAGKSLTA